MAELTEVERIREGIKRVLALLDQAYEETVTGNGVLTEAAKELAAIHLLNETRGAREKARTLPPLMVSITSDEESIKSLLAIGFDLALSAVVPQLDTYTIGPHGLATWEPPINPFRRESTRETERCPKCKHSLASDNRCHSLNCECDCDGTDATGNHG